MNTSVLRNLVAAVLILGVSSAYAARNNYGAEYIMAPNGLYFLVSPTSLDDLGVWDCFVTSATANTFEGLSVSDLVSATGGKLYTEKYQGVLKEKDGAPDREAQQAINQVRNVLDRMHTRTEIDQGKMKFNKVFKIAAIVKRDRPAAKAGTFEEVVESMLIVEGDKPFDGTANRWLNLNARGNEGKVAFFQVACPDPNAKKPEPKKEDPKKVEPKMEDPKRSEKVAGEYVTTMPASARKTGDSAAPAPTSEKATAVAPIQKK